VCLCALSLFPIPVNTIGCDNRVRATTTDRHTVAPIAANHTPGHNSTTPRTPTHDHTRVAVAADPTARHHWRGPLSCHEQTGTCIASDG
jgi:hypothetical protein